MKKILILYPELFRSYEKFHRKVLRLISNSSDLSLVFPHDHSGFITRFTDEDSRNIALSQNSDWSLKDITHAIIFDDGEEFTKEAEFLASNDIPLRLVEIAITRVVNIKNDSQYQSVKSTPTYEYIGRGSYWGNPYSMYDEGESREEVIRKYKYDFDNEIFPNKDKSEVYKLAGKRLGCFCKPHSCHGDILADFLNSWDDGR